MPTELLEGVTLSPDIQCITRVALPLKDEDEQSNWDGTVNGTKEGGGLTTGADANENLSVASSGAALASELFERNAQEIAVRLLFTYVHTYVCFVSWYSVYRRFMYSTMCVCHGHYAFPQALSSFP